MNKVYACSDVHANLKQFNKLLEFLDDNDKLYVIGDVVDKGPDKLEVLKTIMKDDRITLLMGNHDLMMLSLLSYIDEPLINETEYYINLYDNWINYNQGSKTLNAYLKLDDKEKKEILDYLFSTPVLLNIEVDNKKYILVHAYPLNDGKYDVYTKDLISEQTGLLMWYSDYVWERSPFLHIEDKILITGHTPSAYYDSDKIVHNDYWYDLDCGLAMLQEKGKLGVLCLNDLSEIYFKAD